MLVSITPLEMGNMTEKHHRDQLHGQEILALRVAKSDGGAAASSDVVHTGTENAVAENVSPSCTQNLY